MSKFNQAAALATTGQKAYDEGDFVNAGDAFARAWNIIKPKAPKTLWNAARSFEQAVVDEKGDIAVRRKHAIKAKMLFIEWHAIGLPHADNAVLHIKGLENFISKANDALSPEAGGKKKKPKLEIGGKTKKTKKAGIGAAALVIGALVVGGAIFMARKKG